MRAADFLYFCENAGIGFYTGVPDSLLKGLCDELYDRYGSSGPKHIVAHNEGGAVALCAGHFLATGKPGLCYMQNSGLGNAVNPLTSLMDPAVYSLPCLLVIGWRGEPGIKDEPQHVKQGQVTLSQLEILDIPYFILSQDTGEKDFIKSFESLLRAIRTGHTAAIVVRKGALTCDCRPDYRNGYTMTRETAASVILACAEPSDVIVSTTGKLSREIFELREKRGESHSHDFLTVGSMGHAGMIALQIAMERPERTIWCLDGDGAALMHLGTLPLIAKEAPKNLIHAVINNGAHETVGGMPVLGRSLNLCAIAEAAGYPLVRTADSADSLRSLLSGIRHRLSGPAFIEIQCACGARSDLGRPTTTPAENRDALMSFLRES